MIVSFLIGKFRKRKPKCLNYSTFTKTHTYSAPWRRLIYFVLALNFRRLYVVKQKNFTQFSKVVISFFTRAGIFVDCTLVNIKKYHCLCPFQF